MRNKKQKNILKEVKTAIQKNQLLKAGDKVVIGVSGGADSVALVHILNSLKHELGIQLHIAHVNHKLRKSADTDERFVKKLVGPLNIPYTAVNVNIKTTSQKTSIEEVAREKRFNALFRIATKQNAQCICLAHHQDDLAETVLMRILRGSGLAGMQAILPKRKIDGFIIIRPLLNISKNDILNFLKTKGIKYRTDPTNKNKDFLRNRIRLELLPLIKEDYNPNISSTLANLANTATADYSFLQTETEKSLQRLIQKSSNTTLVLNLKGLLKKHPSLQRMIIRLSIERIKGNTRRLTLTHIREVEDLIQNRPSGSIVNLPSSIQFTKTSDTLSLKHLRSSA